MRALGLMSGTSMDGVDAALLETDGEGLVVPGESFHLPYDAAMRARIASAMKALVASGQLPVVSDTHASNWQLATDDFLSLERDLTLLHAEAVTQLLAKANLTPQEVDVVGFHGQTLIHRPEAHLTWQIGDGALLAERTGIDVVCDFRRRDMAAGGQGAPLVPLYHRAIIGGLSGAVAVVNIGGVANVTGFSADRKRIAAFDTGPGNVLLDEWVQRHTGETYDRDGRYAQAGQVDAAVLAQLMAHPFFERPPPKSLDRYDFSLQPLLDAGLSLEDGAATLAAFTAQSMLHAGGFLPEPPQHWIITGGGRLHPGIMQGVVGCQLSVVSQHTSNWQLATGNSVLPVEALGLDGDMLEAQAFAYLAVRSLLGLPLSLPETTGASRAVTGGAFYRSATRLPVRPD
jgi:anhydro-N-acetylmuramic acid kinase